MSLQDRNTQPDGLETIWCHLPNGREEVVEVPADLVVRTLMNQELSNRFERCTYGVSRSYVTARSGHIDVVMYWPCFFLDDPLFAEQRAVIDRICDEAAPQARVVCRTYEEYRQHVSACYKRS